MLFRSQHIHWLHRFTVAGGLAVVAWLFLHIREMRAAGRMLQRAGHSLIGLYGLQIVIGALNPLTGFAQSARVGHLAVAASIWVVMILMWYAGRYSPGADAPGATPADRARTARRYASRGMRLAKIAGREAYRSGKLLSL